MVSAAASQKKVVGLIPGLELFCVEFANSSYVWMVLSMFSGSLP